MPTQDDERILTKAEAAWVKRLKKCLDSVPPSIEICIFVRIETDLPEVMGKD